MQPLNLNNNYTSGLFAEFLAKLYLRLLCYRIIRSRYSAIRGSNAGEIDIIAKRGKTLVFIEVKKRTTIDLAKEAIFISQQKRIRFSAESFIAQHPKYQNYNVRFDAICFNKHFRFEYIKNAF